MRPAPCSAPLPAEWQAQETFSFPSSCPKINTYLGIWGFARARSSAGSTGPLRSAPCPAVGGGGSKGLNFGAVEADCVFLL